MKLKIILIIYLLVSACTTGSLDPMGIKAGRPSTEIIYMSTDGNGISVFSEKSARFGPLDLTLGNPEWPSSPARYFESERDVQCVSFGVPGNTEEYAIKRPIKDGDHYKCLATSFHVIRCFNGCKSAIIEREHPLVKLDGEYIKSYFYIDNCRGLLVISLNGSLAQGIPLDAEWLHGEVGILADKNYPNCDPLHL